ncbi:MAG TPA: four-helix bundle copper-binding protein [Coriobacteriia bacterium]|nr:four-helix bundle copper-binding protein [Coriobacteriia bacterium]
MESLSRMFEAHPMKQQTQLSSPAVLLQEIATCEAACTLCADACLSERDVQMLAQCISLNLYCADQCAVSARSIGRPGHQQFGLLRMQLDACREACRTCAEECERHEHEHCRICAESCRSCEQACSRALESMMATA